MAFSRQQTTDLGQALVAMYRRAETELYRHVSVQLARGLGRPTWADEKMREVGALRRFTENLFARLDKPTQAAIVQAVAEASTRGRRAAIAEVREWVKDSRRGGVLRPPARGADRLAAEVERALDGHHAPGLDRTTTLAGALVDKLGAARGTILRSTVDKYREVVGRATAQVTLGVKTQRQAAADAWGELAGAGFTGFTDKAGRNWALDSYVDMATRTALVQAGVESHMSQLGQLGITLVQVSNAPAECYRCRPWEGKILDASTNAPSGAHMVKVQHGIEDRTVNVWCAGNVADARAAGLLHPNCRHTLGAYIPGVTSPIMDTEDPQGERDRDKLRALEREARNARRAQVAALTPEQRRAADKRHAAAKAAIKAHVGSTGIQRQPGRESPDFGQGPKLGPAPKLPPGPPPPPPAPLVPPGTLSPVTGWPGQAEGFPSPRRIAPSALPGFENMIQPPRPVPGYTPDPARVAAAQRHADRVTTIGLEHGQGIGGETVRGVYQYAAQLAPNTTLRLTGVWNPGPNGAKSADVRSIGGALAFYASAAPYRSIPQGSIAFNPDYYNDSDIRRQLRTDELTAAIARDGLFSTKATDRIFKVVAPVRTDDLVVSSLHEFGHHLLEGARGYSPSQPFPTSFTSRAFNAWAAELGVEPPKPRTPGGSLSYYELDQWVTSHSYAIGSRLSTYGAKNVHEWTAEQFALYAMWGPRCPAYVREYVEALIATSERMNRP